MTVEERARRATLALLVRRGAGVTACPSEVARALDAQGWREAMPAVHAAVDALVADGWVRLSWRGVDLAERDGPYRIRLADQEAGPIRSQRLP